MVADHFPIPPQFYGIPSLSLFAHVLRFMLLRNSSKLIYFDSLLIVNCFISSHMHAFFLLLRCYQHI